MILSSLNWEYPFILLISDKKLNYRRYRAMRSCQLKSYQLPRNSAETTCTTSPEQIEVMKSKRYSKA